MQSHTRAHTHTHTHTYVHTHTHTRTHTCTQGESSTGTHQSLAGLSEICKQTNTLLLVDTVCILGGVPLFADDWGVDAIY